MFGERGKKVHGQAKRAHGVLGALGAGNKDHAQREPGDPRHVVHHGHEGLGHGMKAFEGVLLYGEKLMWTGIKWGVTTVATIGALTYATHNVDMLHPFEGYFDLPHDIGYGLGIGLPVTGAAVVRRGWIEGKAIVHEAGQALDHGETAVRSAAKTPGRIGKRFRRG